MVPLGWPFINKCIAAIAQVRGAKLTTRNVADFGNCGLDVENPAQCRLGMIFVIAWTSVYTASCALGRLPDSRWVSFLFTFRFIFA